MPSYCQTNLDESKPMHIGRGLRGNRLVVHGRREELVQWHVVDEDHRHCHIDMQPVWRWRKSVIHNWREEVVCLSCWLLLLQLLLLLRLLLLLVDRDCPDMCCALFALADGV